MVDGRYVAFLAWHQSFSSVIMSEKVIEKLSRGNQMSTIRHFTSCAASFMLAASMTTAPAAQETSDAETMQSVVSQISDAFSAEALSACMANFDRDGPPMEDTYDPIPFRQGAANGISCSRMILSDKAHKESVCEFDEDVDVEDIFTDEASLVTKRGAVINLTSGPDGGAIVHFTKGYMIGPVDAPLKYAYHYTDASTGSDRTVTAESLSDTSLNNLTPTRKEFDALVNVIETAKRACSAKPPS
jgi:hypothetical protein